MNAAPLAPRLLAVAEHVLSGHPVADIGTDHAYLPTYLVSQKICPRAIACDLRPGPLLQAEKTVARSGLRESIELRLSDGLSGIEPDEVATITIAGMGGQLAAKILERDIGRFQIDSGQTRRLICQVNDTPRAIREMAVACQLQLVAEELLWHRRFAYWIFVFDLDTDAAAGKLPGVFTFSENELEFGTLVASRPTPAYLRWLQRLLALRETRWRGLQVASSERTQAAREAELRQLAAELSELRDRIEAAGAYLAQHQEFLPGSTTLAKHR